MARNMVSGKSLLAFLHQEHHGEKVGQARGDQKQEVSLVAEDTQLSKVYDDYQTYLGNLMTMGTLIVGFIATGAFLNVQFTGAEDFRASGRLQGFIEASLKGAVAAMVAVIVTFVFSTVASNHRLHHGLRDAIRIVRQAMLLAGFAEILIYFSFVQYLTCMEEYSLMNYLGPDICPFHEATESFGSAFQRNSSACANTGKDLYNAARRSCGDPKPVTKILPDLENRCQATNRDASDWACRVYDCYSHSESFLDNGAIDFGWRGVPINLEISDFGYDQFENVSSLSKQDKQFVTKHKAVLEARMHEAFLQVIDTNSKVHCGQDNAEREVHALCNRSKQSVSSTIDDQACSTARIAWAQTQQCTQATSDGALQCHKVCAWVLHQDCLDRVKFRQTIGAVTPLTEHAELVKCIRTAREKIKNATIEQIFAFVKFGLWFVVIARSIAVVGRSGLLMKEIFHEQQKSFSCCEILRCVDIFGVVSMLHDCYAEMWTGTQSAELQGYQSYGREEDSLDDE